MDNSVILIIVLGVLALAAAAIAVTLFLQSGKTHQTHDVERNALQAKLAEAARAQGQLIELERTLTAVREDKCATESTVTILQTKITNLSTELERSQTEAEAVKASAEERIRQEQRTAVMLVEKEKEATTRVLEAKNNELKAQASQLQELKTFIEKAPEMLEQQFKALSADTLKDVTGELGKMTKEIIEKNSEKTEQDVRLHKQQIQNMLQPVEKTLGQLDRQVKHADEKRAEGEAALKEKIEALAGAGQKLSNALNKPVIRGSWAETKLETILEAAGLERDRDFVLQAQVQDGDQRRIVDALVNMPNGGKLVIDSKNLMASYVEYANASDEEAPALLEAFQKLFKTTLKNLSRKEYAKHWPGIDAVVMFMPDEGMYLAAIDADRSLVARMVQERVYVASPNMLMPILATVAYVLGLERQNQETQAIVDAGRKLYDSFGTLFEKLDALGKRLDAGVEAYNQVVATVEGNVLPKTRTLHKLGVTQGAGHVDLAPREKKTRALRQRSRDEVSTLSLYDEASA